MKFLFIKVNRQSFLEKLGNLDIDRANMFLEKFSGGQEMELVIRKRVNWDVSRMRKFFEGPVCNFVRECYSDRGVAAGKGAIREMLKQIFLGTTEEEGLPLAVSTTTLDFDGWKDFLNNINDWCIDKFDVSLPPADNVGD